MLKKADTKRHSLICPSVYTIDYLWKFQGNFGSNLINNRSHIEPNKRDVGEPKHFKCRKDSLFYIEKKTFYKARVNKFMWSGINTGTYTNGMKENSLTETLMKPHLHQTGAFSVGENTIHRGKCNLQKRCVKCGLQLSDMPVHFLLNTGNGMKHSLAVVCLSTSLSIPMVKVFEVSDSHI